MSENIEVRVSHQFKASAERVYDAWLDPDKTRARTQAALQSMGLSGEIAQIEIDPRVGGAFLFSDMRDAVNAGFGWFAENLTVRVNPRPTGRGHSGWHYYYLYGLERAGILAHVRFLGPHDWYEDGALLLATAYEQSGKLEKAIQAEGPETVAMFIAEPVQGAGPGPPLGEQGSEARLLERGGRAGEEVVRAARLRPMKGRYAERAIETGEFPSDATRDHLAEFRVFGVGRHQLFFDGVMQFAELDSDKWRQYAKRSWWPKSLVYAYEAGALSRWEQKVLHNVDAVTLVSDEERRLMLASGADKGEKVHVVKNGVDMDYFDPGQDLENPFCPGTANVVFTGAMDYYANAEGVCWFVESVWPGIRARRPDAQFWIVGSNPTKDVSALSEPELVKKT